MDAKAAGELIEAQLTEYGLDPAEARLDPFRLGRWAFTAGSAEVAIELIQGEGDEIILECRAPLLVLSGDTSALFAHVLELNAELLGGAFSVAHGMLEVRNNRRTEALDPIEFHQMVMDVAALADHYDDVLAEKFGMTREADLD